MTTSTDLQPCRWQVQANIAEKKPIIESGLKIYDSRIDHLTIIIRGQKNGINYNEILDFRLHQEKPAEFLTFINDYITRLIAERNILQEQLKSMNEGERNNQSI